MIHSGHIKDRYQNLDTNTSLPISSPFGLCSVLHCLSEKERKKKRKEGKEEKGKKTEDHVWVVSLVTIPLSGKRFLLPKSGKESEACKKLHYRQDRFW